MRRKLKTLAVITVGAVFTVAFLEKAISHAALMAALNATKPKKIKNTKV